MSQRFPPALILALAMLQPAVPAAFEDSSLVGDAAGRPYPQAERLIRQDPRWLGADGAHSIRLDEQRIFWTFADSLVALPGGRTRHDARMPRNTVAIQTGAHPDSASLTFHWREEADGTPLSFFPDRKDSWYWPQASLRLEGGPLVTFLFEIENRPGEGLGFATVGYAVAVIERPEMPPEQWRPSITRAHMPAFGMLPATALVRQGEHVVALAITQGERLAGALVRYPEDDLAKGDLRTAEWWAGPDSGWLPEAEVGPEGPAIVLDHAGSECSIHWDAGLHAYIHITSYGFGSATIGVRTAEKLSGPWSQPTLVYRPPESDGPRPFVYGAVAQPALAGPAPGELVITYSVNSFEFRDLFTPEGHENLYWPRAIVVDTRHWQPGPVPEPDE